MCVSKMIQFKALPSPKMLLIADQLIAASSRVLLIFTIYG